MQKRWYVFLLIFLFTLSVSVVFFFYHFISPKSGSKYSNYLQSTKESNKALYDSLGFTIDNQDSELNARYLTGYVVGTRKEAIILPDNTKLEVGIVEIAIPKKNKKETFTINAIAGLDVGISYTVDNRNNLKLDSNQAVDMTKDNKGKIVTLVVSALLPSDQLESYFIKRFQQCNLECQTMKKIQAAGILTSMNTLQEIYEEKLTPPPAITVYLHQISTKPLINP